MFNLLKSDLYRTVRTWSFWVLSAILVVGLAAAAMLLDWIASPEFSQMVNDSIEASQSEFASVSEEDRAETMADLEQAQEELEATPLNDRVLTSMTHTWANSFLDGGMLGLIGSLFVTIYLLGDFKGGFVKNLPMDHRGRRCYYGEKVIYILMSQAYFLVLCASITTVSFWVLGFTYESIDPFSEVVLWLVLTWIYESAFALIIACITWFLRSEAVSSVATLIISSGILGAILVQLCMYFGNVIHFLVDIPQWLLASARSDLRQGVLGLMETNPEYLFSTMPAWGHAAIVSCAFAIIACVIIFSLCRKRDIA